MKSKILILGIVAAFIVSCNSNKKEENIEEGTIKETIVVDGHNAQNALDYFGVYKGVTPCADCEGIATTVKILDDKNFEIETSYLGKSSDVYSDFGTYEWNQAGNTITLSGGHDIKMFFVAENQLIQLDTEGNKIQGDLASKYILQKEMKNNEIEVISANKIEKNKETVSILVNAKWKLVKLMGKGPENKSDKDFVLVFDAEGRFSAFVGCNNLSGEYEIKEGNRIVFGKVISTMMACVDMATEQEFKKILEIVDNYTINDKKLSLNKARMAPLAIFEVVE